MNFSIDYDSNCENQDIRIEDISDNRGKKDIGIYSFDDDYYS